MSCKSRVGNIGITLVPPGELRQYIGVMTDKILPPLPDSRTALDKGTASTAFAAILDGQADAADITRFLCDMAERGETAEEIAAAAAEMRSRMIQVDNVPDGAIDVCGTGGDGQHSLNVSTAVSIVVAACGVPVAKHGNRAASSKAGAADTLEALGLDVGRASQLASQSLNELNIAFIFARSHHPALGKIADIRRQIGRRTIFNLLGPLCNPAMVSRQLIGLAHPNFIDTYAKAAQQLGLEHAMIVSGAEGLDELSIAGPSHIAQLKAGHLSQGMLDPVELGLTLYPLDTIRGGDADFNAGALNSLLIGDVSPYRQAVILNAAAALMVSGHVSSWEEGLEEATETLDRGSAKALLDCWVHFVKDASLETQ